MDDLEDGSLRRNDLDILRQFKRDGDGGTNAPSFSIDQPTTLPQGTAALKEEPAEPSPEDDENRNERSPTPPARPRFDLFEGPSPAARATPSNAAAMPAEPIGSPPPETPPSAAYEPVPEAGPLAVPADPMAEAFDSNEKTARVLRNGSLPAAPIRPSRLEQIGSRLNQRTLPLRQTGPAASDDPFAPLGLRLGAFTLYTAVEQSLGLSSNVDSKRGGEGGAFSDTALSARLQSDWSRHAAEVEALANYRRNFAGEETEQPDVTVDGALRLDVDRLTTAVLRGGVEYRKEDAADLDSLAGVEDRADRLDYRASGEVEHEFGRAYIRGTLAALRETASADKPGASNPDFSTYSGLTRVGYRFSPAFAPFVEGGLGRRVFDESSSSFKRDSTIEILRGGIGFDLGEKVRGEFAAGYARNRPDEDAIDAVGAPTFDAKLFWSPRRGTDVAFTATTTFDPDPLGTSTATLYEGGVALSHRATARLALDAGLTGGYRDSELAADTERSWGVSAGFTYWLNRSLALTGLATHRDVDRQGKEGDYGVESVKLGIRFQH